MHHLAFRTPCPEELAAFYAALLRQDPSPRGNSRFWFFVGPTILMIEPRQPGEPPIPVGTMEFFAFPAPAHEDWQSEVARRLAGLGREGEARTEHTVYLRDPDGRRVGFSDYVHPESSSQDEGR